MEVKIEVPAGIANKTFEQAVKELVGKEITCDLGHGESGIDGNFIGHVNPDGTLTVDKIVMRDENKSNSF